MTAYRHETLLNLASHPMLWLLARIARRVGPLWRVPRLGIVVSDAALAHNILQRDDEFRKTGPGGFAQTITRALGPTALANMSRDEHRWLRAELADVLSATRAAALVRDQRAALTALCERLASGDTVDLVDFIHGWSGRITFDALGIAPPVGREDTAGRELVDLSARMAAVLALGEPSRRQQRIAQSNGDRLSAYFRDGYARPAPPSSLAGRLQLLGLTFEDANGLLTLYTIAGTLTVSSALPRIIALLVDYGLFPAMHATDVAAAIDEGLRYTTPLPATVRIAQRDVVLHGQSLVAGTRLFILTCNLTRDARVYADPDRFDITRRRDPRGGRPWYGAGPHYCAGYHLAQRELSVALTALIEAVPALRIVKRRVTVGALVPAYAKLIVRATR